MRIPFLFTCFVAALLAAAPVRQAQAADDEVSFDLFYNNLADDGDWYNTPEYGYVWQPYIAYKSDKWRPYTDGYWAQTDSGWTWVSYENFGWATYHYGRWTRLKDIGWAWVPGYDWGPGWVSWRTSDDYVGWAPLPPKVERGVAEGRFVERGSRASEQYVDYNDVESEDTGYTPDVDVQFDIGPANYNFCETRYFGAPVIREVCLPPERNFVICERTTNVTNIYYRHESNRTVVYNNGPDFIFINSHAERPIPRLRLERRTDPVFLRDGLRSGGNPSLVRGGVLQVAAPMVARRQMNFTQIKPQRVKETLAKPQVIRGWSNAGADTQSVDRLRERFKEQAKSAPQRPAEPIIPPAAVAGVNDRASANEQPRGPAGAAQPATDAERQARRDARQRERQTGAQPGQPNGAQPFVNGQTPAAAPGNGQPLTDAERIARRDARQKEREDRAKATGQPAAANPAAPGNSGNPAAQGPARTEQEKEARRAARQAERAGQSPAQAQPPQSAQPQAAKDPSDEVREARRAARQQQRATQGQETPQQAKPAQTPQAEAQADQDKAARRAARQTERANPQPQPAAEAQPQRNDQEREARRAAREQQQQQQVQQAQQQSAQQQQQREARRAAREQQPQAQPQAQQGAEQQQEREARRAAREQQQQQPAQQGAQQQQEREARRAQRQPEQPAAQPQPQAQAQAQPDREARRAERQKQRAQPGQTPAPGQ